MPARPGSSSSGPAGVGLVRPAEAAHGHVLDAVESLVQFAERFPDGADVLPDVVPVAAAFTTAKSWS